LLKNSELLLHEHEEAQQAERTDRRSTLTSRGLWVPNQPKKQEQQQRDAVGENDEMKFIVESSYTLNRKALFKGDLSYALSTFVRYFNKAVLLLHFPLVNTAPVQSSKIVFPVSASRIVAVTGVGIGNDYIDVVVLEEAVNVISCKTWTSSFRIHRQK
jgi:hypothetical protein